MNITVSFKEAAEVNALIGLLDLAVKSGGLQVASNAVYFQRKLESAMQATQSDQKQPAKNVDEPAKP